MMINQSQVDIVFGALCCYREARGEVVGAQIAQLSVIKNRVLAHWIGDSTVQEVVEHPWQFSAMTAPGDPNLIVWPKSYNAIWKTCLDLADQVFSSRIPDPTNGAVFYHDTSISVPRAWGPVEETLRVGRLVFYRPKKAVKLEARAS